jgi:hypothetical protein
MEVCEKLTLSQYEPVECAPETANRFQSSLFYFVNIYFYLSTFVIKRHLAAFRYVIFPKKCSS